VINPLHHLIGAERFLAHFGEELAHLLAVQIQQVDFGRSRLLHVNGGGSQRIIFRHGVLGRDGF
jgi:hypothetical protein